MTLTLPGYDLQAAIVQALLSASPVTDIVGKGVYDRVSRDKDGNITTPFPFVAFGDSQTLPELAECTDAATTHVTLHCWSRKVGFPEVNLLARAVAATLHDATLTLATGMLQSLLLDSSHVLRDPDGLTSHAVLTFSALTDAN